MKTLITLAVIAVSFLASPALAFQCPSLVKQINASVGNRFDATASEARRAAAQAATLHAEGKHAESVKAAQDAIATLSPKK
jgi:hypothetical protein